MNVKFICLNLWSGGILIDNILDFLSVEKPDILAVQEVYKGSETYNALDLITTHSGFKYLSFAPTYTTTKSGIVVEHGNAVFSRFPIITTDTIFYDIPYDENFKEPEKDFSSCPRNLQHVVIRINKHDINVFNTHGIWGFDDEDTVRRLNMSNKILEKTKNFQNVILAGDFNIDMRSQTIKNIEKSLSNLFVNELQSSFNLRHKSNPIFSELIVDAIFVSKDINVVEKHASEADVSDHLPLIMSFRI